MNLCTAISKIHGVYRLIRGITARWVGLPMRVLASLEDLEVSSMHSGFEQSG